MHMGLPEIRKFAWKVIEENSYFGDDSSDSPKNTALAPLRPVHSIHSGRAIGLASDLIVLIDEIEQLRSKLRRAS